MEQKILTEKDIPGLLALLESSDEASANMGFMILERVSIESVAWLLIIYKNLSLAKRLSLPDNAPITWRFLSIILKVDKPHKRFSVESCYNVIKHCANNDEALSYMEQEFGEGLKKQMITWGYKFLKNYKITLIRNDNRNIRQEQESSEDLQRLDA